MYTANFYTNSGTRLIEPLTGTNKAKLISEVIRLANAERRGKENYSWHVFNPESGRYVAEGARINNIYTRIK